MIKKTIITIIAILAFCVPVTAFASDAKTNIQSMSATEYETSTDIQVVGIVQTGAKTLTLVLDRLVSDPSQIELKVTNNGREISYTSVSIDPADSACLIIELASNITSDDSYRFLVSAKTTLPEATPSTSSPLLLSDTELTIDEDYYEYYHRDSEYDDEDYDTPSYGVDVDSYRYSNYNFTTCVIALRGSIVGVKSLDENIVTIDCYGGIHPVGVGTATIEVYGNGGTSATFTITVPKSFVKEHLKYNTNFPDTDGKKIYYGLRKLTIDSVPNATITAKVSGETYTATVSENDSEHYIIKLPRVKTNGKINFLIESNGGTYTKTFTVDKETENGYEPIKIRGHVYKTSKSVKIVSRYVEKGDTIQVKIGNKTYKKRILQNTKKYTCTIKVSQSKSAGKKISLTLYDKQNQKVATKTSKVYYASKVRKGMTKAQCKLVPGWGPADSVSVYGRTEVWWYDDGSSLTFYRGRLRGWSY